MKFTITHADKSTEDREMSDCNTVEDAHNAVAGSAPGVDVAIASSPVEAPVEPPAQA